MVEKTSVPGLALQFSSGKSGVSESGSESITDPLPQPPSPSPSPTTPVLPDRPHLNLLLAEDNYPDALLVRSALRIAGLPVDVHIAADGEQAIDFIANAEGDPAAPCPDLLLLDINLPKADGFEVLRRLRSSTRWKSIPVMIVSSSDSSSDRSEAARLGASYFPKPPSYGGFLRLGEVLKEFMAQNGLI
jgi:CheY-like chemotaxis protein